MLKQHAKSLARIFSICDLFIILVSFYVAYSFRFESPGIDILNVPIQYKVFSLTCLVTWIYLSNRSRLYASKRLDRFRNEVLDVCKNTMVALIVGIFPSFFIREYPLSRLFLLYSWALQTSALICFRLTLREALRYIRQRGYNYRQILLVGRNVRALNIANKIEDSPHMGLRLLGCIDAHNGNSSLEKFCKLNLIGDLNNLEQILRENVVDEVFVTLPIKSFYSEIAKIVETCEQVGVEVKIPMDLFSLKMAKSTISNYDDYQMIDFYTSPKMNWQLLVKRLIDLIISATLLVIMIPLFFLISLLIKIDSRGPVFFKQKRVGYNGRLFNCLKFRTMVKNAEKLQNDLWSFNEMDGPVFKIQDDPRVTRVGLILRKTSIDELPQLLNVFWGDMSLVGPRPPLPSEVTEYELIDRRRLSMKPGITCLWQVSGRNSIPFEKWMELDRQYIDQWSLGLDLKILVKTIPVVLRGSGQ